MTEKIEIPALLYCEQGNPVWENSKSYTYTILNFPALDFLICKIKEREF